MSSFSIQDRVYPRKVNNAVLKFEDEAPILLFGEKTKHPVQEFELRQMGCRTYYISFLRADGRYWSQHVIPDIPFRAKKAK